MPPPKESFNIFSYVTSPVFVRELPYKIVEKYIEFRKTITRSLLEKLELPNVHPVIELSVKDNKRRIKRVLEVRMCKLTGKRSVLMKNIGRGINVEGILLAETKKVILSRREKVQLNQKYLTDLEKAEIKILRLKYSKSKND